MVLQHEKSHGESKVRKAYVAFIELKKARDMIWLDENELQVCRVDGK